MGSSTTNLLLLRMPGIAMMRSLTINGRIRFMWGSRKIIVQSHLPMIGWFRMCSLYLKRRGIIKVLSDATNKSI